MSKALSSFDSLPRLDSLGPDYRSDIFGRLIRRDQLGNSSSPHGWFFKEVDGHLIPVSFRSL